MFRFHAAGPNIPALAEISVEFPPRDAMGLQESIQNNMEEGSRLGKWLKAYLTGKTVEAIAKEL